MSALKRKREDDEPQREEPDTEDATCVTVPNASPTAMPSSPVDPAPPPSLCELATATPAPSDTATTEVANTSSSSSGGGGASATTTTAAETAPTTSSASSAPPPPVNCDKRTPKPAKKILICGKEITLKESGGRRKRKPSLETLVFLAYHGQLVTACKANNMLSALEIYQEMKSKGIKQDLAVRRIGSTSAFIIYLRYFAVTRVVLVDSTQQEKPRTEPR